MQSVSFLAHICHLNLVGISVCSVYESEPVMWHLRNRLMFLVDNLQYYLQVDVLESQYTLLLSAVQATKDFEQIQKAHTLFQANILSQTFLLTDKVSQQFFFISEQQHFSPAFPPTRKYYTASEYLNYTRLSVLQNISFIKYNKIKYIMVMVSYLTFAVHVSWLMCDSADHVLHQYTTKPLNLGS